MSAKSSPAKRLRKGSLQETPYMVLAAVFILVFAAALGIYLSKNLLDYQRHATAIDAVQNIYNSADLLSAGAEGSTKTLWVKIPEGYEVTFSDGEIRLSGPNGPVGEPMHIDGVRLEGNNLKGGKHHLKLEYRIHDRESGVTVSEA